MKRFSEKKGIKKRERKREKRRKHDVDSSRTLTYDERPSTSSFDWTWVNNKVRGSTRPNIRCQACMKSTLQAVRINAVFDFSLIVCSALLLCNSYRPAAFSSLPPSLTLQQSCSRRPAVPIRAHSEPPLVVWTATWAFRELLTQFTITVLHFSVPKQQSSV